MSNKSIEKIHKEIEKKQKDLTEKRIEELSPVVQEIIKEISQAELPTGNVHAHDNPKYLAITKNVLGIMLDNNVRYADRNFLFQLVLQPFDQIRDAVIQSLSRSFERAETKRFGKDFSELLLGDIDEILKE